jgi:hypothetical protein
MYMVQMYVSMYSTVYMFVSVYIHIARQKIVKALTFNGQRIVGLCKSLTLTAVNFQKSVKVSDYRR